MKTVITAKLKLSPTPEQFAALRATQLAYRDALNYVSRYAFEQGKMSNRVALQDGTYDEVRARFQDHNICLAGTSPGVRHSLARTPAAVG